MTWFLSYIIFAGLIFLSGYLIVAKAVGKQAARCNIGHALPWILFGLAIALTSAYVAHWKQSGWSFIHIAYITSVCGWLLGWPVRKRNAGTLLLNAGRTWHNQVLLWVGVAEGAIAAIITWVSWGTLTDVANTSTTVAQLSLKIAFWWMVAAFIISLGLNRLELRENGICFFYNLIPWLRMKSYSWDADYTDTLVILIHPRFAFLPASIAIKVPAKHRDDVDRIIQSQIPFSPPDSLALS